MPAAVLLVAALIAFPALSGPVRKCRGPDGQPVYQDRPCTAGAALRDLSEDPPNLSVIPFSRERVPPPARATQRAERETPRAARAATAPRRAVRDKPGFDAAERRHLKEGMSESEVRARLGPPDQRGRSGKGASWTYLPAPGDPQTVTLVVFDQGRVARVERSILR